jgi:enoyl-CoA hydratase
MTVDSITQDGMPDIRRTVQDGILTLTFTRPSKLNAITPAMLDEIRHAVADMTEQEELRVLVLTAEGRYFTAGHDIATLPREPGKTIRSGRSGMKVRAYLRGHHEILDSLEKLEKPVIIAVQGPCLGLGLEMAVSCDFRFAAERASFSLPEIPKLGTIAGSGGISRLTRLVGPHWARWIALASKSVDAQHALRIGLVHAVFPDEGFLDHIYAFAKDLVALPAEALALAKLAIDTAASVDRGTARDFDRVANTILILSEKNLNTVAAYRDKTDKK